MDRRASFWLSATCILFTTAPADAQLQITEIMYDTIADESAWEWFEVRNVSEGDLDLLGSVVDDRSTSDNARFAPSIGGERPDGTANNSVIPARGVAILYNGKNLDFDASRFRLAWNLDPSVPLIGIDGFQSLNNSGDAFGLWRSLDRYNLDLSNTDDDEALEVGGFQHALAWIDYGADPFPAAKNATIQWTGEGDYRDGATWTATSEDTPGTVRSTQTLLPTTPLNSRMDVGNPGVVVAVGAPGALMISELMYNPASDEPSEWEWLELVNDLDTTIDFSNTPYYLDDLAGNALPEANVTQGKIAAHETAVLYRDTIGLENIATAWGTHINFIPVSSWPALNSTGDTVGLWSSRTDYELDNRAGDRTFDQAQTFVTYVDGGPDGWPNVANGQSISVFDLEASLNEPENWVLSTDQDGVSWSPELVLSSQLVDHLGGDLGTPGVLLDGTGSAMPNLDLNQDGMVDRDDASLVCDQVAQSGQPLELVLGGLFPASDFDFNGRVDFDDFVRLSANFGTTQGGKYSQGDANCDAAVNFDDFVILSTNFGQIRGSEAAAVPEPDAVLSGLALFGLLPSFRTRRATQ